MEANNVKTLEVFFRLWTGGDIEGLFIAEEEAVTECLGVKVYYYDVLGKHSQVEDTLRLATESNKNGISIVTDDQTVIEVLQKVIDRDGQTISGLNPLYYAREMLEQIEWERQTAD